MVATFLTVLAAGLLGGGVVANVTALVVIAGAALALIAIFNGVRTFAQLCELRRD